MRRRNFLRRLRIKVRLARAIRKGLFCARGAVVRRIIFAVDKFSHDEGGLHDFCDLAHGGHGVVQYAASLAHAYVVQSLVQ